jgi:hypothetical protein
METGLTLTPGSNMGKTMGRERIMTTMMGKAPTFGAQSERLTGWRDRCRLVAKASCKLRRG